MKKIIFILTLFSAGFLYSLTDAIDNTSLYNKALGGPHTGMVKGFDTFFNNPALFSEYSPEFSFFDFGLNLKGDSLELLNLYLGDELTLDDPTALINALEDNELTSLLVGVDLTGPIRIGKIGNNWGWLIKNNTNIYLDLPGIASTADIISREDFILSLGVALPIKFQPTDSFFIKFVPGFMARLTMRGEIHIESDLIGFLGYMEDFSALLEDYPVYVSPMFAIDGGFNIIVNNWFSFSGVVKDLYTPILKYPVTGFSDILDVFSSSEDATGNLVYREINFGLASDIPLGLLEIIISDLDVYIDYFDLLQFEKNLWLHFGAGVDLELLEKFHLLAGINEGLLSLGLNVDIGGLNVGFAMYGTEEGTQPGINSTFNFLVSIGISF